MSVFLGSATPLPKGDGTPALPIFGVPFYLFTQPLTQNYQMSRGNIAEAACFYRVSHAPNPMGRGPSAPNFGVPSY